MLIWTCFLILVCGTNAKALFTLFSSTLHIRQEAGRERPDQRRFSHENKQIMYILTIYS
jgi:hypothetical protein